MKSWIVVGVLAVVLCGTASADETAAGEVTIPSPAAEELPTAAGLSEDAYVATDGRSAVDAWYDARKWSYGTDLLFPFTRGMEEVGITGWARWPMGVVTVPMDLVCLPGGLVAGLYGS